MSPTGERAAAVYFIYNRAETVVYIGVSFEPAFRVQTHRKTGVWRAEIDAWEANWYVNRAVAERAELMLIAEHQPIYNVAGTPLHREVSTRRKTPTYRGGLAAYYEGRDLAVPSPVVVPGVEPVPAKRTRKAVK
jgi:hypothetical protein